MVITPTLLVRYGLDEGCKEEEKEPFEEVAIVDEPPNQSLLDLFVQFGGLKTLAKCLPALYPYHWPEGYTSSVRQDKSSRYRSHALLHHPSFLPFHSTLMLGLCLKLTPYGVVMKENLPVAMVILRMLLGAELTSKENNMPCLWLAESS